MKIAIYSRPHSRHSREELTSLLYALESQGFDYSVNIEFADMIQVLTGTEVKHYAILSECDPDTEMAFSYGGDGTFLDTVRLLGQRQLPVIGINSGRLGFLANVPIDNMRQALSDIHTGRYTTHKKTLLKIDGDLPEDTLFPVAFNEFSIQRTTGSMISVEAYVNSEMVARYWGDGVLLSTPAGSTAYSLSVGGPVIAPGCACFVLSPIAPHNLSMRPVVVPDDSLVSFSIQTRGPKALVTIDNTEFKVADGSRFSVEKSGNSVLLVKLHNISFYDTLRSKLMWGLDPRDEAKN